MSNGYNTSDVDTAYEKYSRIYTHKSYKHRNNKTMEEAFNDFNKALETMLYLIAAELGIIRLTKWVNSRYDSQK